jgi:NAD+ diphosphatase
MSTETGTGRLLAFRGSELLVYLEETEETPEATAARLPSRAQWDALGLPEATAHPVGTLAGEACFACELPTEMEAPAGMAFHGLRRLWGMIDEEAWKIAGRAVQIVDWDRNHRYCGRCGSPTELDPAERSRTCPRCRLQHFPRLSPAVIVLVTRGDEMLLARSPHFAPGVYSTLAGFVEPGESLEEAVAREVEEETGVTLADIRYFGSQPWPFPNSLMIGFTARWAAGDLRPQPGEIEDARWFDHRDWDNLPVLPGKLSIARALIESFLAKSPSLPAR